MEEKVSILTKIKGLLNIENFKKLFKMMAEANDHDKLMHFFYGYFIFKIASIFIGLIPALIVVVIFAIGKEVIDYLNPNNKMDLMDFAYTILPGVIDTIIGILF